MQNMDKSFFNALLFNYRFDSQDDILRYGKKLEGKTIQNVLDSCKEQTDVDIPQKYYNTRTKGLEGSIIEQLYFGLEPNSRQEADFKKAGVELKVTCIEQRKDGTLKAGERLSITNIDYKNSIEPDFYKSHVWEKIRKILLVQYLRDKSISKFQYKVFFVNYFTPSSEDICIIQEDYRIINHYLEKGLAHKLSESLTNYLGAATKGRTAKSSTRPQSYGKHIPARKRNYSLKNKYMEYILHSYVLKEGQAAERIVKDIRTLHHHSFENYINGVISSRIGMSDKTLCAEFGIKYDPTNNKQMWASIVLRMLGIRGDKAEEFLKAGIEVKTIKRNSNGYIKESMSFPAFQFKELANEKWKESEVYKFFSATRFLFVVFKEVNNEYILTSSLFWGMPMDDLEGPVRCSWERTVNAINEGVVLTKRKDGTIGNNFPKISDKSIIHVRPHANRAAYKFEDGTVIGNVEKDANELPDGRWMTTQCFWLNNSYLSDVLDSKGAVGE